MTSQDIKGTCCLISINYDNPPIIGQKYIAFNNIYM